MARVCSMTERFWAKVNRTIRVMFFISIAVTFYICYIDTLMREIDNGIYIYDLCSIVVAIILNLIWIYVDRKARNWYR